LPPGIEKRGGDVVKQLKKGKEEGPRSYTGPEMKKESRFTNISSLS